jgi:hypothetical protein
MTSTTRFDRCTLTVNKCVTPLVCLPTSPILIRLRDSLLSLPQSLLSLSVFLGANMDLILVLALEGLMGTDLTLVISRAREREGMRDGEGHKRRKEKEEATYSEDFPLLQEMLT